MNSTPSTAPRRIPAGQLRHLHQLRRLPLALALAGLMSACGGGHDESTGDPSSALECEREAYACSWSTVARSVVERSSSLAEAVRQRLDDGASTDDAVAWLQTQETLADEQHDADRVRFRLPGGRAVWAARAGSMGELGEPASVASTQAAAPRRQAQRVIQAGQAHRSALLLAPYAYQDPTMGTDAAAELLSSTPGFSGHVKALQNRQATDEKVVVDSFRDFADYDVIYVATHGGTLCWTPAGASAPSCRFALSAQESTNPVVDAIEDSNVGVELLHYAGRAWLVLTGDFFRHTYPNGLDDKLFFFNGFASAQADLALALHGRTSAFLGWTADVSPAATYSAATAVFEHLAQGVSVQDMLRLAGPGLVQADGAELLSNDRDLRLRDLVAANDLLGGRALADGETVQVTLRAGDGVPDSLLVEAILDGIPEDRADQYRLQVSHDGHVIGTYPVGGRAQPMNTFRWRLPLELPLGIDGTPGAALPLQFSLKLPEGGESQLKASPVVAEPAGMAATWAMTSTTVQMGVGTTTTRIASVMWERDASIDPSARYQYYRILGGTVTELYVGDVAGCQAQYEATIPIAAGTTNHTLKFDTAQEPPVYDGLAIAKGEPILVQAACSDGSTLTFTATPGGAYFSADDMAMSGNDQFGGVFNDGAQLSTVIEYSFSRVE